MDNEQKVLDYIMAHIEKNGMDFTRIKEGCATIYPEYRLTLEVESSDEGLTPEEKMVMKHLEDEEKSVNEAITVAKLQMEKGDNRNKRLSSLFKELDRIAMTRLSYVKQVNRSYYETNARVFIKVHKNE